MANGDLFKSANKKMIEILLNDKQLKLRSKYGTLNVLDVTAELGILPVRNFRGEKDERTNQINAQSLYEKLQKNRGKPGIPVIQKVSKH